MGFCCAMATLLNAAVATSQRADRRVAIAEYVRFMIDLSKWGMSQPSQVKPINHPNPSSSEDRFNLGD
jgi:hypothetical protein